MTDSNARQRGSTHVWIRNNVVGLVALFVALSGTTYAAQNTGDRSGAPAQKAKKKKAKRGPAGPQGPQGSPGAQGPKGDQGPPGTATILPGQVTADELGATTVQSNSVANSEATKSVPVTCPAGTQMVSGGGGIPSPGTTHVLARSEPSGNGWSVTGHGTGTWTLQVYAVCLL